MSDRRTHIQGVTVLSTPLVVSQFLALLGLAVDFTTLAQKGTPVEDSNQGCHTGLVGFTMYNVNMLHSHIHKVKGTDQNVTSYQTKTED